MAARQLPERDIGVAIVKRDFGPVDLFGHHFSSVRPSSMTLPGVGAAPPPLADQILGRALTSAGGGASAKPRYAKVFALVTFQFPLVTFRFPLVTFQFPLRTTPEGLNHDHGSNTIRSSDLPECHHHAMPPNYPLVGAANFLSSRSKA